MTIAATTRSTMRRSLYWIFATSALGGAAAAVLVMPSATAAPDPCAASQIARTIGWVATNTGNYLDSHPDTNAALTGAAQQQPAQALASLKTYFDANPQAGKDMQALQLPLAGLSTQCKLPISPSQALQLLQGMQGGQLPGGATLPGGLPSPLGAATPGSAATPALAGTPALPATGPLPGPTPAMAR